MSKETLQMESPEYWYLVDRLAHYQAVVQEIPLTQEREIDLVLTHAVNLLWAFALKMPEREAFAAAMTRDVYRRRNEEEEDEEKSDE